MTHDPTEAARREMIESGLQEVKAAVSNALGESWDTDALRRDFTVEGFLAPFVSVRRKSDGVKGTLEFSHSPRVYFNFQPDSYTCKLCGQHITDGKPCGCGARRAG